MKFNLGEALRIAGRLILAAPVIIEAVGPVLKKRKRPAPVNSEGEPQNKPDDGGAYGTITPIGSSRRRAATPCSHRPG